MHNWGSRTNGPQGIWGNRGYGSLHVLIPGIAVRDRDAYYSILCHTIPYYSILYHTIPYLSINRDTITGWLAQLSSARYWCGRSEVRFPVRSNRTQCCQRLAIVATFLRSCVVQAISRGDGPRNSLHASA